MASYTPEELQAYISKHGGIVKTDQVIQKDATGDPIISGITQRNPQTGEAIVDPKTGKPLQSPNPAYRLELKHTLGDGTVLAVLFDGSAGPSGGWIMDPSESKLPKDDTVAQQNADTAAKQAAIAQQRADDAAKEAQARQDTAQQRADDAAKAAQATQDRLAKNDAARIPIEQQNANTSTANSQLQAARDAVDAKYKELSNQVAMGQLSNSQAIEQFREVTDQFNAQRDMLTSAQSAGDSAVKDAQLGTANQVGPGFGANFARGLQGVRSGNPSMVNYSASDFTYPTPDYAGLRAKASAAVLSRLAPYAARMGQTTYQPQPVQPDVLSQAANSVVSQAPPYQPPQSRQ